MQSASSIAARAAPPLVLGVSALMVLLAPNVWLASRVFVAWQRLAPLTALRPAFAAPAEFMVLAGAGLALVLLLRLSRLIWAGLFTIATLAAIFYLSLFAWVTRHWALDAATPAAGLIAIFLSGILLRAADRAARYRRLRHAFNDMLPRAALEKIAGDPRRLSLEGETRTITYLVCGIRGLAGLAAAFRDDPRGFTQLMERLLTPLMQLALAHGGTIDRLTADGFAAFWNAPLDDPQHAHHACDAANAMSVTAGEFSGPGDTQVEIGIGIATGPVIAGGFGAHDRLNYSVHGEAVSLAGRLHSLSPQYGPAVIVSQETSEAAARGFAFLEVDMIAFGPADAPVRLYAMQPNPASRASPKYRALATFHEHLFQALRGQQWAKARGLIEQARKLSGASQTLYDLHLKRIGYFERNPPGENWDGAFRPILK